MMESIGSILAQLNFVDFAWLFFAAFVIHELEEWNIDQFERRHFEGLPPDATDKSARMWIGLVILIGLAWCTAATWSGSPVTAAWIFLPAVAIMTQNGLQHIYWTVYFRQYAPGVVTAAGLLVPMGFGMLVMAALQQIVPLWYVILLFVFMAALSVQTVAAGSRMTPLVRAINQIGIMLAERVS